MLASPPHSPTPSLPHSPTPSLSFAFLHDRPLSPNGIEMTFLRGLGTLFSQVVLPHSSRAAVSGLEVSPQGLPPVAALEPFSQAARFRCFYHGFGLWSPDNSGHNPNRPARPRASLDYYFASFYIPLPPCASVVNYGVTSLFHAGCHCPPYRLRSPAPRYHLFVGVMNPPLCP